MSEKLKNKLKKIRRYINVFLFLYLFVTVMPFWYLCCALNYDINIFGYFGMIPYTILLFTFEG